MISELFPLLPPLLPLSHPSFEVPQTLEPLTECSLGQLCVAPFSQDGRWYRAVVVGTPKPGRVSCCSLPSFLPLPPSLPPSLSLSLPPSLTPSFSPSLSFSSLLRHTLYYSPLFKVSSLSASGQVLLPGPRWERGSSRVLPLPSPRPLPCPSLPNDPREAHYRPLHRLQYEGGREVTVYG